jgi:hypothetical protein
MGKRGDFAFGMHSMKMDRSSSTTGYKSSPHCGSKKPAQSHILLNSPILEKKALITNTRSFIQNKPQKKYGN